MAEKRKYGELDSFDGNWIDQIDWTDPDQAREAAKKMAEQWATDANSKLQNLHSGMTKAQQGLSEWEKFRDANAPILTRWNDVAQLVYSNNGIDGLVDRLNTVQNAQQHVETKATEVASAYNEGEISWQEAQSLISDLRARKGDLDQAAQWIREGRQKDMESIQQYVAQATQATSQQMAAVLQPILDGIDQFAHQGDRKPSDVLRHMASKKLSTFDAAWKDLYGEQEMRDQVEKETRERFESEYQQKHKDLETKYKDAAVNTAMIEGSSSPTAVTTWRRKAREVSTDPAERTRLTLKRLGVGS